MADETPEGLRDLHSALAAAQRGDRNTAADALRTLRQPRLGRLAASDALLRQDAGHQLPPRLTHGSRRCHSLVTQPRRGNWSRSG